MIAEVSCIEVYRITLATAVADSCQFGYVLWETLKYPVPICSYSYGYDLINEASGFELYRLTLAIPLAIPLATAVAVAVAANSTTT